jgi:hypothetical protein
VIVLLAPRQRPQRSATLKATAAVLLIVVAGLSWSAQAETLALRCEGTKITTEIKDPGIGELFPGFGFKELSAGEEDKGAKDARSEERVSTDVVAAIESKPAYGDRVTAFGHEFEIGYRNDVEIRAMYTVDNAVVKKTFFLEAFFVNINRLAGTLEAEQLKYKKNGWLYMRIKYSLDCKKMERKF